MFDNAGSTIKDFAGILFVIEIVATIIVAIVVAAEGGVLSFIIIFILGILISYVSSLFLSAFGELVESSTRSADNTAAILNQMKNKTPETPSAPQPRQSWEPITNSKPRTTTGSRPSNPRPNVPEFWTCPNCGRQNHRTAGTCGCGEKKPS